ncbi:MAG: NupC/NupG family nucleoside CNT transporter [Bacteroidetes bacterium]|nr:NupC/NupG family nucleoside CNT transporter [Bacteroidota bacterium]
MDFISIIQGIIGLALIVGLAWTFSNAKKEVNWRLVGIGIGMQIIFGIFIIKGTELGTWFGPLEWPKLAFEMLSGLFVKLLSYTTEGAKFVFGNLAVSPGFSDSLGFFFAFQVLPTIIFFASIMSVLYHLGVMQKVVQVVAWVISKSLKTSGAETLSVSANIFVGQTEAPLVIKPFIKKMTESELLAVMIGGMATIAGGVMAAYVQMLGFSFAQAKGIPITDAQILFASQLLGASIMAAPAALLIAKILIPETGNPETRGQVKIHVEKTATNVIEAAASGAGEGLKLALNVGAMLLAFIALIALINALFGWVGDVTGLNPFLIAQFNSPLKLELLLGLVLQFVGFGIGVPWSDALNFGSLIGTKLVLNEFVAYLNLADLVQAGAISEKTIRMATFALCGFANISSIAIQIGGIGPLAPERQGDLAKLGVRAVFGGMLATLMTATIAGVLG